MRVESVREIDVDRVISELDTKANMKQEDKKIKGRFYEAEQQIRQYNFSVHYSDKPLRKLDFYAYKAGLSRGRAFDLQPRELFKGAQHGRLELARGF